MNFALIMGMLLPFWGTTLGASTVFLVRKRIESRSLSGFAAGVMMAASVWSLIIPAVEMSAFLNFFSFFPMLFGLWFGFVFILALEKPLEKLVTDTSSGKVLFFLAVVLHNIPEGMAVGASFAYAAQGNPTPALLLSSGMALQNIPEGAIISAPLEKNGMSKSKAFVFGTLSGIVEPIAALATLMFSSFVTSLLPYLLGFAAGAMIYVTVKELLPEASGNKGVFWFFVGFSLMMVLDMTLG